MKRTGLTDYVYDFSVDYDAVAIYNIKDIHKHLMKKITVSMKMFRFVKKVFSIGLTILPGFTNMSSLSCISMSNQECKARPQVINVNSKNSIFYPLLKQVNVVAIVIILMIRMQKFVFLMLKYSI